MFGFAHTVGSPTSKNLREPAKPLTLRAFEGIVLLEDTTVYGDCTFGCLTNPSLRGLILLEDVLLVDY